MITEDNSIPTSGNNGKQVITIVHGAMGSNMGRALLRMARQLQLQLVIQEITERELETRARERELDALLAVDTPALRSRDWSEWDRLSIGPACALYERRNLDLVQARRDCPHGHQVRERARRIPKMCVGWRRFSTRTRMRHEKLRPKLG